MQHILNIAFDFDDERAKQIAENTLENNLDSIIKNIILDRIAPEEVIRWRRDITKERNWSGLEARIDNHIKEFLEENREQIMEIAAEKLIESTKRTKAWKEKVKEI